MTNAVAFLFQHSAVTHGICVRMAVNFLPEQSRPEEGEWCWSYHIRIENGTDQTIQLLSRHWRISDDNGAVFHVDGDGVVGQQPILEAGASYDYVSGLPLATDFGSMEGFYHFLGPDGQRIEVRIPYIPLAAIETAD